jgi:preprotein translocase subunit SecE
VLDRNFVTTLMVVAVVVGMLVIKTTVDQIMVVGSPCTH